MPPPVPVAVGFLEFVGLAVVGGSSLRFAGIAVEPGRLEVLS